MLLSLLGFFIIVTDPDTIQSKNQDPAGEGNMINNVILFYFHLSICMYVCIYVYLSVEYVCGHVCHSTCMEIREQPAGTGSLLPSCKFADQTQVR